MEIPVYLVNHLSVHMPLNLKSEVQNLTVSPAMCTENVLNTYMVIIIN